MESQGYLGILHSNPLGVMCQSFSRCIAACSSYRRPGPRGRGGDFFALGGCDRPGRIHSEPEAVTQGIGTRRQRIQGVPREGRGCGSSETAASNLHACSSAHNLACFAATPARSSSARLASICPPALQPVESAARHRQASSLHGCAAASICPKACRRNDRTHDS